MNAHLNEGIFGIFEWLIDRRINWLQVLSFGSVNRRKAVKLLSKNFMQDLKETTKVDESQRGKKKILVAEDEEAMRELVIDVLEYAGYSVIAVNNGMEAIEIFKQMKGEIGLVILDMSMPEMDGDETFRALKQISTGVPVFLSSGYIKEEKKLLDEGVAGFIGKPYRIDDLVEKVRSVLGDYEKS
jgi:two-component system, cell cycle sensor histidine kinase and response regulator CckA